MKDDVKTKQVEVKAPAEVRMPKVAVEEDKLLSQLAKDIEAAETDERAKLTGRAGEYVGFDATDESLAMMAHIIERKEALEVKMAELEAAVEGIDRKVSDLCMSRRHLRNEQNLLRLSHDAIKTAIALNHN